MMRRLINLSLTGVTAYYIAGLFQSHEGPLACPAKVCGPDELPTLVFFTLWGLLAYALEKFDE